MRSCLRSQYLNGTKLNSTIEELILLNSTNGVYVYDNGEKIYFNETRLNEAILAEDFWTRVDPDIYPKTVTDGIRTAGVLRVGNVNSYYNQLNIGFQTEVRDVAATTNSYTELG